MDSSKSCVIILIIVNRLNHLCRFNSYTVYILTITIIIKALNKLYEFDTSIYNNLKKLMLEKNMIIIQLISYITTTFRRRYTCILQAANTLIQLSFLFKLFYQIGQGSDLLMFVISGASFRLKDYNAIFQLHSLPSQRVPYRLNLAAAKHYVLLCLSSDSHSNLS